MRTGPQKINNLDSEYLGEGQFRVPQPKYDSFFLPPFYDVMKLIRLPHSLPIVLGLIEQKYDINPKLSRPTKYKIVAGGAGKKAETAYRNILRHLPFDPKIVLANLSDVMLDCFNVSSNAAGWLSALEGVTQSKDIDTVWMPLVNFIKSRCLKDLSFIRKAKEKNLVKLSQLEQSKYMLLFLRENTLLSNEMCDEYLSAIGNVIDGQAHYKNLSKENFLSIIAFNFHNEIDFYFSLLAHYEYGLDGIKRNNGFIVTDSRFILVIDNFVMGKSGTIFGAHLELLRDKLLILKESDTNISWRELARAIPIESENDETDLSDKQYKTLKDWRKGKNLPSRELLGEFISNLTGLDIDKNTLYIVDSLLFSKALDELVGKWLKMYERLKNELSQLDIDLKHEEGREIVNNVLLYYQCHWNTYGSLYKKK